MDEMFNNYKKSSKDVLLFYAMIEFVIEYKDRKTKNMGYIDELRTLGYLDAMLKSKVDCKYTLTDLRDADNLKDFLADEVFRDAGSPSKKHFV